MGILKNTDHDFDLMNVGAEELFNALCGEVLASIKKLPTLQNTEFNDIRLDENNVTRRKAYGKDYNLYPLITLPILVNDYLQPQEFSIILNSFEIALLRHETLEIITSKELSKTFEEFMSARFPEADYKKKRSQYFQVAKTIKKIEDGELFN